MPTKTRSVGADASCPICNSAAQLLHEHRRYQPLLPSPGDQHTIALAVFYCDSCAHGFLTDNFEGSLHGYYVSSPRRSNYSSVTQRDAKSVQAILGKVSDDIAQSILEIGGGFSPFPQLLMQSQKVSSYLSVDPAFRFLVEHPASNLAGFSFTDRLPDNGNYSVVVARQVLEHIEHLPDFLEHLKSLAAPDAIFYFEVPNFIHTLQYASWFDICFEHKHYFTQRSLVSSLLNAGLSPFVQGHLNGGHDLYVMASLGDRPDTLTMDSPVTDSPGMLTWAELPEKYFGYGLNSNLESILNFSRADPPVYLFDDGAGVSETYWGKRRIEVGAFSDSKLLQLNTKHGHFPIVIFAPFSVEKIRAKLPRGQAIAVIDGSCLLFIQ